MISRLHIGWFYGVGIAFVTALLLGIIYDFYYVALLPLVLLVGFLAIFRADILIYLSAFLTPLSVTMHETAFGAGIILPTEPVILVLMAVATVKFLWEGFGDRDFLKHPVTLLILFHLLWLFITSLTSSMPLVSFKYLISRSWYIVVFYFFASKLFYNYKHIKTFLWALLSTAALVIGYIVVLHSTYGFSRDAVFHIIQPFFWIHGVYAAMMAMLVPVFLVLFLQGKELQLSPLRRSIFLFLAALFTFAVIFSYTRAAWLSLLGAFVALLFFLFRINPRIIYGSVIIALLGLFYYQDDIALKLSRNKTGSNSKNMEKHLESATNIKNDPSNLERLNRWSCAVRMYQDKPVFGFGPGTYMFQYAPYQLSYQKTVISTNFATLGHAHSEFLGPLAESGLVGMLSWIALYLVTFLKAIQLIYKAREKETKTIVLALTLGLLTYFIHGFLNSYFDYDKIAVPFWAFISIIVCLDVRNRKLREE